MRSAIVADGNFEIFEDGTIFRIQKDGTKKVPRIYYNKAMKKEISIVRYRTEEGKYVDLSVHRLIAEAFLPNPDQKRFLLFKNDNPRDFGVDNLIWDDGTLIWERKKAEKERNTIKCPNCGEDMDRRVGCIVCKKKQQEEQRILANKQKRLNRIINELATINIDTLNDEHKKIILMRRAGKTYEQIGKEINKSVTQVSRIIERAKRNAQKMNSNPKSIISQIDPIADQENSSKEKSKETDKLRRMFLFGEGGSSRYFYKG